MNFEVLTAKNQLLTEFFRVLTVIPRFFDVTLTREEIVHECMYQTKPNQTNITFNFIHRLLLHFLLGFGTPGSRQ